MAKEAISRGFSGPQKGISYSGNHAYAFSGTIVMSGGADTTMLLFDTGTEYIRASFSFGTNDLNFSGAKSIGYKISFNDQLVFAQQSFSDSDGTLIYDGAAVVQDIIIPAHTLVKIESTTNDVDDIDCYATLTGRTYS